MKISDHQQNLDLCLSRAAAWLDTPVRALSLGYSAEQLLRRHLRLEARRGLIAELPHFYFSGGPKGLSVEFGIERYQLQIEGRPITIARLSVPALGAYLITTYDFWAVPVAEHRRLYRFLRRLERSSFDLAAPLMRPADRETLWNNTIGFLRHGRKLLKKYGLPQKRGVVLLGSPGNGKTMASRWLLSQCHRHGLRWHSVTAEEYDAACQEGRQGSLFELDGPGIVLFDDLDQALRDRDQADAGTRRTAFLTELDGLYAREGIVYLFTSNMRWQDLDPAFRRPGRIDLFLSFPPPDTSLRREFIGTYWHPEVTAALELDRVVTLTEGLSFAELDELKKLLVLGYLDQGCWDLASAWSAFTESHGKHRSQAKIGFAAATAHSRPTSPRPVWNKT